MKPTKRQISIVEHFVKKTTKSMMNENKVFANGVEIEQLDEYIYLVKTPSHKKGYEFSLPELMTIKNLVSKLIPNKK